MYSKLWMDEFNKQITKGEHAPREFLVAQFVYASQETAWYTRMLLLESKQRYG